LYGRRHHGRHDVVGQAVVVAGEVPETSVDQPAREMAEGEAVVSDAHRATPAGCRSSARQRRSTSRSCRIEAASVELIPIAGKAGDELDARQDAAICRIVLWLGCRQETERRP
jgi:hypothetical protein